MASIDISNASVSYFVRKGNADRKSFKAGKVGAPITVGKRYIELAALQNVSLSFKDGDRVGLIGINGSGKSTLLKLCAGALSTQSGTVTVDGTISPQFSLGAGLKPALSGRRNTELKCLYMGIPQGAIARHVEDVADLSGLGGYFDLPLSTYSAGMRSRLVMSLMRLIRGSILVMDEWVSVADASVNKKLSTLQADLINNCAILILASHSRAILHDWTKTLVWLDNGTVRANGPTAEVYADYAKFIAER